MVWILCIKTCALVQHKILAFNMRHVSPMTLSFNIHMHMHMGSYIQGACILIWQPAMICPRLGYSYPLYGDFHHDLHPITILRWRYYICNHSMQACHRIGSYCHAIMSYMQVCHLYKTTKISLLMIMLTAKCHFQLLSCTSLNKKLYAENWSNTWD